MIRAHLGKIFRVGALLASLAVALPATALDKNKPVTWKIVGIITGQSLPFTTAAYFARPLVAGEIVEMTFKINPGVDAVTTGSVATYGGAITKATISGSDWLIALRAPLDRGAIAISNDDVEYGDSLALMTNTPIVPGKIWYLLEVDLRNPGGPHPGVGPWAPFSNLALPRIAPALGYFPNTTFTIAANRQKAGQTVSVGGAYVGQILSIECDD